MTCQEKNVVNLNLVKRKIFDDFNTFNHRNLPTTNPIEQRDILQNVLRGTPELSSTERDILLIIVSETVCMGYYYTFITQDEIAEQIGCTRKSVYNAYKKLIELNWIAAKKSQKYTKRTITDFNVEKVMPIPKETKAKVKKLPVSRDSETHTGKNYPSEENYTVLSKDRTKSSAVCATVKNPKSKKALIKTWKKALLNSDFADKFRLLSPSAKDYDKLTSLVGNEHIWKEGDNRKKITGRWPDSPQKLHDCAFWSVRYWLFIRFRLGKPKFPKYPDIGWFVSCIKEIYDLWLEECGDESDENVILLKEKAHIREMKDKYRQILKDKE